MIIDLSVTCLIGSSKNVKFGDLKLGFDLLNLIGTWVYHIRIAHHVFDEIPVRVTMALFSLN